jgi:hypothetical protein
LKLSKAERAALKQKFDGRCAYCGCELGDRWHADHVRPVTRLSEWVEDRTPERSGYFKQTGTMHKPEFDGIDNMNPACVPCNMDKGGYHLEQWRERLTSTINTLTRDAPAYRFAKRFGLVVETGAPVVFYFEQRVDLQKSA